MGSAVATLPGITDVEALAGGHQSTVWRARHDGADV
jgi:hypothetical protein